MTLKEWMGSILDLLRDSRADVPHGGQSWCNQVRVCGSPCIFKAAVVSNKGATTFWLWICDDACEAGNPVCAPLCVPGNSTQSIDWTMAPRRMMNGLLCLATTDPLNKTLLPAADAWFEVAYDPKV